MNALDFFVLFASILGIAIYGMWQTRHRRELSSYVRGSGQTPWYLIGISVMATQASAITFLSTPGQGYLGGFSFIQIYLGIPLAMIIISMFFLPIYNKLNVYTAYEYLEKRFDCKTRLLGTALFLLQRGLGAGLTVYAPAIVLTTVFGWPLNLTIICCGLLVLIYTVMGGSDAVTLTQKYQMAVIFAGMVSAACILFGKLPSDLGFVDTLKLAGHFHKTNAISLSTDLNERYTLWSGLIGATFLMLSYFGTDQSQVQRYISGSSLRESRLGLMFNAVCKIPMQFGILLIGVMMFVFYQFHPAPLFFDSAARHFLAKHHDEKLEALKTEFDQAQTQESQHLLSWIQAKRQNDNNKAAASMEAAIQSHNSTQKIRDDAGKRLLAVRNSDAKANDADYVFITFILEELPHGVIGLLIAAFFAATLSSKAAELNALGTSTCIDIYRRIFNKDDNDYTYVRVTKLATAFWGILAIVFALYAHLVENLIQAVNILGSIFYGVMLGIFLVAFFLKRVGGTAVFWAALIGQGLVCALFSTLTISYLWYPLIGCVACIVFSLILQAFLGGNTPMVKEQNA